MPLTDAEVQWPESSSHAALLWATSTPICFQEPTDEDGDPREAGDNGIKKKQQLRKAFLGQQMRMVYKKRQESMRQRKKNPAATT